MIWRYRFFIYLNDTQVFLLACTQCFFRIYLWLISHNKSSIMQKHIIDQLYDILQQRKSVSGEKSYVASLYEKGSPKIAEKILEEAQEVIDEALALDKNPNDLALQKNIRSEAADLLFHLMVMLAHHDVKPNDVFDILRDRFGISGHDEKASRRK